MTAPESGSTFVVVTGGGTGGHVYPALAVADELVARGHASDTVRFLGSARGLEATAVPGAGYAIDLLPGRGFRRSLRPDAVVQNLRTAWDTVVALGRAVVILRRLRPAVVFGVGGYAAAPGVLAARALRIPVVVHEQNAAPGVVNRVAVAFGAQAAVSLPGTALRRATLTGNPVRAAIVARGGAARVAALPGTRCVGVFGGSLGARRVNDATLDLARRWRDRGDRVVRHVTGSRDYQRCVDEWSKRPAGDDALRYELVEYEDDMPSLYERVDVVVTRAGAVTVAELAVSGTPAVVVPLPGAPSDHQTANGRALVEAGAAVLVPDAECDGPRLARELDALLADPARLATMRAGATTLARPDAAARVADLVEEAAGVR
ncbi:MAG: undecaprenyldiphospho-muramoylpentapeptide beta-N-acetylglucosaminyltransferase [Acidimicrobiia bacterium]|jgi:undecaprenyldiphospho-muramoylpentapeptide beta-N-acetylglucosaminyltransferase